MQKIIDGKVYDTDKATLIDWIAMGLNGNFIQYHQCLFQADTGELFIYTKSESGEDIVLAGDKS